MALPIRIRVDFQVPLNKVDMIEIAIYGPRIEEQMSSLTFPNNFTRGC